MKIAKLSTLLFWFGFLMVSNIILAQVPPNDLCIDAESLLVTADSCSYTEFSLFEATISDENFCKEHRDVWFKFLYDTPDKIALYLNGIGAFQTVRLSISIYKGDCTNLELIACDIEAPNELSYAFYNPELIGQMIYIAVNDKFINEAQEGVLQFLCVESNAQELNHHDICSIAKEVNFNPAETCTYSYDVIIAENTYSGLTTNCNDGKEEKDHWLRFQVPEDGRVVLEMEIFSNPNFINVESIAFYSGACTNLELITCFKPNELIFNERYLFQNLGKQEIFMQVVTNAKGTLVYHVCLTGELGEVHPDNDDCITASKLQVYQEQCEDAFIANNINSFNSTVNADCPGFNGLDVWFSFDMPASGKVLIETKALIQNSLSDGVMAVYSGSCDDLVFIACDDDSGLVNMPAMSIHDLNLANETLYVQFWSFNGISQGDFSICVIETGNSAGDYCHESIQVSPGLEESCYLDDEQKVSLLSNTSSGVFPSCNDIINKDMWFEFSYSVGQALEFEFSKIDNSLLIDGKAALYRRDCDDLIFIACDDDSGPGLMPSFDMEEIIDPAWDEDQNFYIQFWDFEQGVGGAFNYCLYEKMQTNIFDLSNLPLVIVPNPTRAKVHISIPQNFNMDVAWRIMTLEGKLVEKASILGFDAKKGFDIDTEKLTPGSYLISIQSTEYHWVEKFVKL